ncbi:MAG: sensor histidine kinase [Geodermatophilaceae bacterium]|nr:sensor histidine kinase [Geodermatophilaceae bacterium]
MTSQTVASGAEVGVDSPGRSEVDFWERTAGGWHVLFAALLLITIGVAISDSSGSTAARTGAVGVLVGWGGWYLATGLRSWRQDGRSFGLIYVAGMLPLCLATLSILPSTSVILFAAIPQIYATIERLRYAVGAVVLLFTGFGIALYLHGAGAGVFIGLGFSALFSAVLGAWIGGIIRQSRQRADWITELRETRAELAEVNHDRGALAERERLSRDIHDTLAQGFTSIVMLLEAADAEIGADDEAVRRHLALARSTARENLAEARSLVAALSPAGLADGSLVDAIRRLVSRCAEELQVRAAVSVTGDPRRLSSATEVVLLRAAQEGLANVRKHAGASQIDVYMDYGADLTTLRVCDDGSGFEPSVAEGFGLAGMRTRAEQAGGSLRLDSTPGAGTTIELRVPA